MKRQFLFVVLAFILAASPAFVKAQSWKIGEGYSVKFEAGDPSGEFTGLKGTIVFDEKNLASAKFDVSIDVASINTGNGMKNTHAKGANWFDAEKFPTINFISSAISKTADGYEAKGTLEMHGVKKDFTMPFTFTNNTFTSSFDVNRLDFNLDDGKHPKMSPTMKVMLNVPVTK
ncbi:MAG TPA: YceI family protein [Cyclobacteriaceae bacterium]|nr:YceI family protein [Cyclobacteriaceae bacterium]